MRWVEQSSAAACRVAGRLLTPTLPDPPFAPSCSGRACNSDQHSRGLCDCGACQKSWSREQARPCFSCACLPHRHLQHLSCPHVPPPLAAQDTAVTFLVRCGWRLGLRERSSRCPCEPRGC